MTDRARRRAETIARLYPRRLRDAWGTELVAGLAQRLTSWDHGSATRRLMLTMAVLTDLGRAWIRELWPRHSPPVRSHEDSTMRTLFDVVGNELRLAQRALRRRPAFAGLAILLLSLGIGANTALWNVTRSVLLRPLPYGDAHSLVTIWSQWIDFPKTWLSMPEIRLYREELETIDDLAIFQQDNATLDDLDTAVRVPALGVSGNLLAVLGRDVALGRGFTMEDARGNVNSVLLSSELWRRRYDADPALVGGVISIEGEPYQVVGILPAGLAVPQDLALARQAQLWYPIDLPEGADELPTYGGSHGYFGVARLASGGSLQELRTELTALNQRSTDAGTYPPEWQFRTLAFDAKEEVVGAVRSSIVLLVAAVLLVFFIATFNVASLSLTEGLRRSDELRLRRSLGASRWRLLRQWLSEAALLSTAGAAVGIAIAWAALRLLRRFAPAGLPRLDAASLDASSVLAAAALAALSTLCFGMWPAWRASRTTELRHARNTSDRGARRAPGRRRDTADRSGRDAGDRHRPDGAQSHQSPGHRPGLLQ